MKSTGTRKSLLAGVVVPSACLGYFLASLLSVCYLQPTFATTFNWAGNNSGNWNLTTATGWNTGGGANYPKTADDVAHFVLDIGGARTITINVADAIIGSLTLHDNGGSTQNFIVATSDAASNKLNFDVATGAASINSNTGSNTISSPVVMNDPLNLSVTGTQLTISGAISSSGAHDLTLATGSSGILVVSGANTYSGATKVDAGTLRLSGGVNRLPTGTSLSVSTGATFDLNTHDQSIDGLLGGGNVLTGGATLTVGGGNSSTTFSGAISETGDLVKIGSGTLTLSGPSTYTGATTINAGTLQISTAANRLPTGTNLKIDSLNSATFDLNGVNQTVAQLSNGANGGGTMTNSAAATTATLTVSGTSTFGGSLTNGGSGGVVALTKTTSGTLTLTGASSYTGLTTISGGAINIRNAASLGSVAGGTTVTSGGALELQNNITVSNEPLSIIGTGVGGNGALRNVSGTNTYGGTVTLAGAAEVDSTGGTLILSAANSVTATNQDLTLAGAGGDGLIQGTVTIGSGTVTKTTTGTWTLAGNNNYSGATSVVQGLLIIQHDNALGTTAGGTSVSNGATLALQGDITVGNESLSVSGFGEGSNGALRNLSGANTYGGTVTLTANAAFQSDAGTLALSAANSVTATNRNLTLDGAGNGVIQGTITTGSGSLTKTGAGDWTLGGANTYTGPTLTNGGKLILSPTGSLTNTAITAVVGGTFAPRPGSGANSAGLTGAGTLGATLSLNVGSTFDMTDGAIGIFNLNQQASFAGTALTIGAGSGAAPTLVFEIGNAATGTDQLLVTKAASVLANGGKISIAPLSTNTIITPGNYNLMTAASGLGVAGLTLDTPSITVNGHTYNLSLANSTATNEILSVSVAALTTAYWSGGINSAWTTINAGPTTNWRTDATSDSDSQAIPSSTTDVFFNTTHPVAANLSNVLGADFSIKSLTFTSGATSAVTIGGANTLTIGTGGISVQSGSGAHTVSSKVALGSPQTWTNDSANLLTVSGEVDNGVNSLTVDGSGNTTISGNLGSGAGSLLKNGAGMLTLSANNTYTGGTTVNAGQLILSNVAGSATGSGSVLVNSGAMIGGGGNADSLVTLASGGVVSPGNSPGTLSFDDHVWNGGGEYLWEMNNATGTAGNDPGWDLLDVENALTINATPADKFVVLITSVGGDAANFSTSGTTSWQIVSVPSIVGFNPLAFELSLLADALVPGSTGFTNNLAGGSFAIRLNQGSEPAGIYLDFIGQAAPPPSPIGVPEPSTLMLGGTGMFIGLVTRRRKLRPLA